MTQTRRPYLYAMDQSVCICGAGTMGRGIVLAVATAGFPVLLYDLSEKTLDDAKKIIEAELLLAEEKKRISAADRKKMIQAIVYAASIEKCRAPIIIEAIPENLDAKTALLREVSRYNSDQTLYATNTSSLSVTAIAEQTLFPDRLVGLHFFNPANRMKLVEIVQTKYNSDKTVSEIRRFAERIGKTAVLCKDAPGFIVNHVARPFYLEALRLAEKQIAEPGTIDKIMESAGFKMGPFHLMDLIGNDINYTVSASLFEALDRPARLKPSAMQAALVAKGAMGKKSGGGFFHYTKSDTE